MIALAEWRKRMGLTQVECAKRMGVRQADWSRWENDVFRPTIANALKIAELTGGEVPVTAWVEEA